MNVIEKTLQQDNGRKRKPYKNSDILWAKIRKYALENGNAAASKKFSKASDNSLTLKPAIASKLLRNKCTLIINARKLTLYACLCINCYNVKTERATEKLNYIITHD